jgi:hypothetical protein
MSIQGAYETATCVVKPQVGRANAAAGIKEAAGQGQSLKELKWVVEECFLPLTAAAQTLCASMHTIETYNIELINFERQIKAAASFIAAT